MGIYCRWNHLWKEPWVGGGWFPGGTRLGVGPGREPLDERGVTFKGRNYFLQGNIWGGTHLWVGPIHIAGGNRPRGVGGAGGGKGCIFRGRTLFW